MNALAFLVVRALHVLVAGLWIGSSLFISALLMPAVDAAGPSGGQVITRLTRRGMHAYMAVLGGTTVVTGVYLLWRFSGGFDPSVMTEHAGLVFTVGGLSGILAAIVGGGVTARSGRTMVEVMGHAAGLPEGPTRDALMSRAARLRGRIKASSHVVIVLQAVALVLMAVGHYV